jgi:hypothetical protein
MASGERTGGFKDKIFQLRERNKIMNSRERILAALKHTQPDRTPVDLGGMGATGISAFAYNRLKKRLGLPVGKIRIYDLEQMLAFVEPEVLNRIGGGAVYLTLPKFSVHDVVSWKEWALDEGITAEVPEHFNPVKNSHGGYDIYKGDKKVSLCRREGVILTRFSFRLKTRRILKT